MSRTAVARPPWWAVLSSLAAPVVLIGGWTLAQALRTDDFSAVRNTISDLAATGAPHRWVMTTALILLGLAYLVTAAGLTALRPASRGVLALAGVTTLLVAAFPTHAGGSTLHGWSASATFLLLALWPATTARRGWSWAVRPEVALAVTALSMVLLTMFYARVDGGVGGLWERLVAAQQALWPPVVVLALRTGARMRG